MELLVIIVSYLLGSIPSGLIVGKVGFGIDIREHGSGNLGGTNSFRILGKKAGLLVTFADILKGTLATSLPFLFQLDSSDLFILTAGAFAVIGHMYPIFAGFRGGKAVATSAGVILAYSPMGFCLLLLVFASCLLLSKYVSLSSMLTGLAGVAFALYKQDTAFTIIMILLTAFVFYRHRANIKRIMNKTESKVKLF